MSLVSAIRNNKKVGTGSCTSVDECWSDKEIADELNSLGITAKDDAIAWAMKIEGLWIEANLNVRFGDDDDYQLKQWENWNK